jgi:DNA-binding beta-propeller fold protein YncE
MLAFGAAGLAGCRRPKTYGFPGYVFVANQEGRAVAAVDLTAFAVARHIRVEGSPTEVVAPPSGASVFVLAPDVGAVHEINASTLSLRRSARAAQGALTMRLSSDQHTLWIAAAHPPRLLGLSLATLRPTHEIPLPAEPSSFDLAQNGKLAVVGFGALGKIAITELDARRLIHLIHVDGSTGPVCFRSDDRCVIAGNLEKRMLSLFDTNSGMVITHLPLAVRPEHYCFRADGGQMFLTGEGMDAVVVVYPHKTPMVAETVLAGRSPGAMAVSSGKPDFLFVTNPAAGNVTILDVVSRRVVGIVAVGAEPCYATTTPDSQYALVLNRASGDMAVIRVAGFTAKRSKFAPLFTMIPVGSRPVSAAVKAV